MASIVISGDTSGAVTLSAPAISGTTTLTLPTTSGTLVVTGGAQTVQFAAGSAASPSITFTGDTNTGIFSPAADTIAFTEGGVESMRIDSSGNVGIGTTNPTVRLYVNANNATATQILQDETNGAKLRCITNSINVDFGNSGGGGYLAVSGAWPLTFSTNSAERMRIDSSGNVGIGTSSPTNKLDVVGNMIVGDGGNTRGLYVGPSGFTGAFLYRADGNCEISPRSGYSLLFMSSPGGTERMRITSGGDVLIGGTTSLANGALIVGNNSSTRPIVAIGSGGVDGTYINGIVFYPWNTTEANVIRTSVSGSAGGSGFQFMVSNGFGSPNITESFRINRTSCTVIGSLSKGSGSFKIDHPLPEKTETHHLVHSFIEGPQADLIYRGVVNLVKGKATVNIDEAAGMTEGTFELLCREVQCFTTNESDWTAVRGKVVGNVLNIEAQDTSATSTISWMVIGERQDKHMYDTEWTNENGKVIVEPLKQEKGAN